MTGVTEEELYNMPTADYVNRRGFLNRPLTVYHVAFQACADLRNVEVLFYISIISVQLFYKNQFVLCTCLVFLVVLLVALLILVITFSVMWKYLYLCILALYALMCHYMDLEFSSKVVASQGFILPSLLVYFFLSNIQNENYKVWNFLVFKVQPLLQGLLSLMIGTT